MQMISSFVTWTEKIFGPYGGYGLFTLAFMESSFFPIPPDLMLIALALAEPSNALFFAAITTIGSVAGGIFGYAIGITGGRAALKRFFSQKKIAKVHKLFNKYEAGAIFIAGFTPIPYKVFTIAAGVFYINFKKFVMASVVGRGLRFFMEAVLIMLYGGAVVSFLENNFNIITALGGAIIIIGYIIYLNYRKQAVVID
jgi:membrane protein YqaA with SNARE-associated domain